MLSRWLIALCFLCGAALASYQEVLIKRGDTLSSVFKAHHIPQKSLIEMLHQTDLPDLRPDWKIYLISDQEQFVGLFIMQRYERGLLIYAQDERYVQQSIDIKKQAHYFYAQGTPQALQARFPKGAIDIFKWLQLQAPKHFTEEKQQLIYRKIYLPGVNTAVYEAVMVKNDEDMVVNFTNHRQENDFYYASGHSMRLTLLPRPVENARISSGFSYNRYHPILHVKRPHLGVDFAAPVGTPVHSTGPGRIIYLGPKGGFGNLVVIKHDATYETAYAHMLRFQTGLHVGSTVKMGDVIGYVGNTGNSTGPHLHYEVHKNKKPVNPLTLSLPAVHTLWGDDKTAFLALVVRLQGMLSLASSLPMA